jgi:hypothetical protein
MGRGINGQSIKICTDGAQDKAERLRRADGVAIYKSKNDLRNEANRSAHLFMPSKADCRECLDSYDARCR